MIKRRPQNWPALLSDYLVASENAQFKWGVHDCVTVAAGWPVALGFDDPLGDLRGQWESPLGAARIFKREGGFFNAVDTRLRAQGFEKIKPTFARRGDLAFVKNPPGCPSRSMMGICEVNIVYCPGASGIERIPLSAALAAWRI